MSDLVKVLDAFLKVSQLAANMGLSMQDLVNRQQQAAAEGREFGIEDLNAMSDNVETNLQDLENLD